MIIDHAADIEISGTGLRCTGAWTLHGIEKLEQRLASFVWPSAGKLIINGADIREMDTAGAWLLHRTLRALERAGRTIEVRGLRTEHEALMRIIQTHEGVAAATVAPPAPGTLHRIGQRAWHDWRQVLGLLSFLGEIAVAMRRALPQPSRIRWRPILYNLQNSGFNALPIVGLLSFLLGIVIAYQGAEQLRRYGANIFIADLVGLSMLRELGPLMTAIIVAGRSGSAYTAQIGTMKVTEEIDALRTIGVSPLELLVIPKILALLIALPLLTVYADMLGVLGGMVMAKTQLGVSFDAFLNRLGDAIKLSSFLVGVGKALVFAAIVAVVGCFQGFQVSGGADSVGRQTTVSVVQAIFLIIITDALFSIVFSWLKI